VDGPAPLSRGVRPGYRGPVTSPASGGLRGLRAALLATSAVSLALAAHAAAGGRVPDLLALATAVVAVTCAAVLVTGRRLGRAGTAACLVVVQTALHGWFALTTGHACSVTLALAHAHSGTAHCLPDAASAVADGTAAATGPLAAPVPALMLAAHLVAVVLTAVLLAHGDALLWRLAATVRRYRPLPTAGCPRPAPGSVPVHPALRVPTSRLRCSTWHLRGPPVAHATG
jgi:hypothetical protein